MAIPIETAWREGAISLINIDAALAHSVSQQLLAHALQKDKAYLLTYPECCPSAQELALYHSYLLRYQQGEPLEYICQHTEFYSLRFTVNESVLIPRHDTELLVDEALLVLHNIENPSVLDLGTGSGAIAISLATHLSKATIMATDISEDALKLARLNASAHHCQHIQFIQSHWFSDLAPKRFDCIVSNPPYLCFSEWQESVALHREPELAFVGGDDGLDAFRVIVEGAPSYLKENGCLLFEHGCLQGDHVQDILRQSGFFDVFSVNDLSGHTRLTRARYKARCEATNHMIV